MILYLETNFLYCVCDVVDKDHGKCVEILKGVERGDVSVCIPQFAFFEVEHVFNEKVQRRQSAFKDIVGHVRRGWSAGLEYPTGFSLDHLESVIGHMQAPLIGKENVGRARRACKVIPANTMTFSTFASIKAAFSGRVMENVSEMDLMILSSVVDHHVSLESPCNGLFCTRDKAFVQAAELCLPMVSQVPDVALGFTQALELAFPGGLEA